MNEPVIATRSISYHEMKTTNTERKVFLACLCYTTLSTAIWLYFIITQSDGGYFFRKYNLTLETIQSVLGVFVVGWWGWSYIIYWLKYWLLERIGVTREDRKIIFSNRKKGFDLTELLLKYPERKIRIIDMVGRRVRASVTALIMFIVLATVIRQNPGPHSLAFGLEAGFLEAIFFSWWSILSYSSSGVIGHIAYGAHARVMDGKLGRSNALLIGTLWGLFKFIMIPIGIQMGKIFPPDTFSTLFVFIWLSYLISDMMGEVIGSIFGRQNIKVWGVGEVNKKSVEGTLAVFLSSLVCCSFVVWFHGVPPIWFLLGLVVSISNMLLELYSPRGTDDFTMATMNAIICLAFGMVYYA